MRWTGRIKTDAEYQGTYTFYTRSSDGVRLWVNDELVIENWTAHALTEDSGQIDLEKNTMYPVRLEYYNGTGGEVLDSGAGTVELLWAQSDQSQGCTELPCEGGGGGEAPRPQIIPQDNLYPPLPPSWTFSGGGGGDTEGPAGGGGEGNGENTENPVNTYPPLDPLGTNSQNNIIYLHSDHLGSVSLTTSGMASNRGDVVSEQKFDPWVRCAPSQTEYQSPSHSQIGLSTSSNIFKGNVSVQSDYHLYM